MLPERVIRNGRIEADAWRLLGLAPDVALPEVLPEGPVIVPLPAWKARRGELLARPARVGVWIGPDEDPAGIGTDMHALPLIAVHFPKFTDGRGYSIAVLLRRRYGFRGELRAFGDVGRDQLFYQKRCGFDSFKLAPHRDPEAALASLEPFSVRYQGSVDDPLPLFRKRSPEGARA